MKVCASLLLCLSVVLLMEQGFGSLLRIACLDPATMTDLASLSHPSLHPRWRECSLWSDSTCPRRLLAGLLHWVGSSRWSGVLKTACGPQYLSVPTLRASQLTTLKSLWFCSVAQTLSSFYFHYHYPDDTLHSYNTLWFAKHLYMPYLISSWLVGRLFIYLFIF